MSYRVEFSEEFTKIFAKLQKKNKKQIEIIIKKVQEIKENPSHYKPLCNELKGYWRVHIDSSFVLVYKIVNDCIIILDLNHHDKIYSKRNKWV